MLNKCMTMGCTATATHSEECEIGVVWHCVRHASDDAELVSQVYWCPDCLKHQHHAMQTEEVGNCVVCGALNWAPTGDIQ